MNRNKPGESGELVTEGVLPVQSFVTPALPQPPGTPMKPRADRPAFVDTTPSTASHEIAAETGPSSAADASTKDKP